MHALQYHHGQLEVQEEANSRDLADHMADWVGPAAEFAELADMLVFAHRAENGQLQLTCLSGAAPLVDVDGSSSLTIKSRLNGLPSGRVGGLAMNLAERRRVRLNGSLTAGSDDGRLEIDEAFTLCRKYLAPSTSEFESTTVGPRARHSLELGDPWLADVVGRAETTFLASVSPDGQPDVAHRGGPAGFLEFDPGAGRLAWPEYLGDGVFKSAGNVRAMPLSTLVVVDIETGDAAELAGKASYTNLRRMRGPRREPLLRDKFDFPTQGRMVLAIDSATKLEGFTSPRRRLPGTTRITSKSTADDQAPQ